MSGPSNRTTTGQGAKAEVSKYVRYIYGDQRFPVARLIEYLDEQGFIIVPKPYKAPARRGNSRKPPVYTGPEMIGKSHTARLLSR